MSPEEATQDYVYFDVLDTDRTADRPDQDSKSRAAKSRLDGEAELKLAILRGQIPVFPQAYGWDSTALLGFSWVDVNSENAPFRWLVKEGYVRVRLREGFASLWDAALQAFDPTSREKQWSKG